MDLVTDVVRQLEAAGHLAVGVVVPMQEKHGDTRLSKSTHLPHEEQARIEVSPVPVIEVSGDDHEVHLLVYREANKPAERIACGRAQAFHRSIGVGRQTLEGTVKVKVCGVNELDQQLSVNSKLEVNKGARAIDTTLDISLLLLAPLGRGGETV
jgi:hypothetical protein